MLLCFGWFFHNTFWIYCGFQVSRVYWSTILFCPCTFGFLLVKNKKRVKHTRTHHAWGSAFWRLIGECWDPEPLVRPTFSEIIVRLDRIFATCNKQGWWKDTFKLPWYAFFYQISQDNLFSTAFVCKILAFYGSPWPTENFKIIKLCSLRWQITTWRH